MPLLVSLTLASLCGAIVLSDLRLMRIPDWITGCVLALFLVWLAIDVNNIEIVPRLIGAGVVFCICFALFAARMMGGGDTKVIPALMLFVSPGHLPSIMLLFGTSLLISILLVVTARQWLNSDRNGWVSLQSSKLPMGVAIGSTGMLAVGLSNISM